MRSNLHNDQVKLASEANSLLENGGGEKVEVRGKISIWKLMGICVIGGMLFSFQYSFVTHSINGYVLGSLDYNRWSKAVQS